jgi:hypothetical protein
MPVELAAAQMRGEEIELPRRAVMATNNGGPNAATRDRTAARRKGERCKVSANLPQGDARSKCTGQTRFADDIALPRMLYCNCCARTSRTRA